jgi:micrococcal nuclease
VYEYRAVVRSVHDGDSIRCDVSVGFGIWVSDMAFRLRGIDTPELGTESGRAARDWLRGRLPTGADVVVRTYKDATEKYGRMLCDIWTEQDAADDNDSLNLQLIRAGHARPYDGGAR